MKKVISVILAMIMILSVVPIGFVSFAEANEYPYRNNPGYLEISEYGFYVRDCQDYMAWKLNTYSEIKFDRFYLGKNWEKSYDWDDNARALGITVDQTPAVGAVAYIDSKESVQLGQLAWVRAFLPDGRVCFETYNWGSEYKNYCYFEADSTWADGYIHFKDLPVNNCPRNKVSVTAKPGRYLIENVGTGLVMTYGNEWSGLPYSPMVLTENTEESTQFFYIRHSAAGKYFIEITHKDGGVVNVWRDEKEVAKAGDPITAFPKSIKDQHQQFYFTPVKKEVVSIVNNKPVENDLYILQAYTDISKVISSPSKAVDSQLVLADYNPKDAKQLWRLIPYKDYTVSFDANGGSTPTSKITVTYHSTYGELPVPTRTGYTFIGWFTEKENGTLITEDSRYELTDNQTLYAHWYFAAHMDINGDDKCDDCGIDAQTFCDCFCHKTGTISKLIYKLILIFWKLLNVVNNQYCPCGKCHWETK